MMVNDNMVDNDNMMANTNNIGAYMIAGDYSNPIGGYNGFLNIVHVDYNHPIYRFKLW